MESVVSKKGERRLLSKTRVAEEKDESSLRANVLQRNSSNESWQKDLAQAEGHGKNGKQRIQHKNESRALSFVAYAGVKEC